MKDLFRWSLTDINETTPFKQTGVMWSLLRDSSRANWHDWEFEFYVPISKFKLNENRTLTFLAESHLRVYHGDRHLEFNTKKHQDLLHVHGFKACRYEFLVILATSLEDESMAGQDALSPLLSRLSNQHRKLDPMPSYVFGLHFLSLHL